MVVVRSPHPHARITGISERAAGDVQGVQLVLTGAEIASQAGPIPCLSDVSPFDVRGRDGAAGAVASQPVLAIDRVRYVGEPVAVVVAESAAAALDAAERVVLGYEPLPAVVTLAGALRPGAAQIWEGAPGNVSLDWCGPEPDGPDRAGLEAAFAHAAHVAEVEVWNNRVAACFLEPRAALAEHDPATGSWTLDTGCQGAHGLRALLAGILRVEPASIRVRNGDLGGGFGARGPVYPEYVLAMLCARRLGRPVRWTATRGEALLSDAQARDQRMRGRLALDPAGRFQALELGLDWRHGAYLAARGLWVMTHYFGATVGGGYRIPRVGYGLRGIFSNTPPIAAYRGIGRMEANYVLERLIDQAARDIGMDPLRLRRQNLIDIQDLPLRTASGALITFGEFQPVLAEGGDRAGWAAFETRRAEAAARGRLRGIGAALYVENDGSTPNEFAALEAHPDGTVSVRVGTQDFGMSHETVYAQITHDALGIDLDAIRVEFGDTGRVERGGGTGGSRSARIGGSAVWQGAETLIEHGREEAAELLEAAAADIAYAEGRFRVAGTDRSVHLAEIAERVHARGEAFAAEADFVTERDVHANGCHVCEVEIDPETGVVELIRHVVVADPGRALNPAVVIGQIHGGSAQGLGQALLEEVVFDPVSGQPLTGSFMDYCLPRADDFPAPEVLLHEVPEGDNPLGVKGVGESAATGAPAAIMNAVADALTRAGAAPVDMPATPERVWRALRGGVTPVRASSPPGAG